VQPRENKKPTVGSVTEVGCLRCDLSLAYRAIPPHSGALLQQQQVQAPIVILWLTGHFLSYSGRMESQFGWRDGAVLIRKPLHLGGPSFNPAVQFPRWCGL
jgi:hypothetical protein